ncbi:MAG: helix-turn-helix transcriptional regulator [Clostridia bacterium]|nr:helix-turn-helix transcriptional regulator [Clostridia bacterium]
MIFYQEHNSKANYNYNAVIYNNCEWRLHFHKNPELVYVTDGELEVQIDSATYLLHANEFALILPNQIHSHHTPSSSLCWIGVFSEDYVTEFAEAIRGKMRKNPVFTCDGEVFSFLSSYLLTDKIPDFYFLKAALTIVCGTYLKDTELVPRSDSDSDLAHQIIRIVEHDFQQNLTLKGIAEALGYEYHYLSRVFSRLFQTNFKAFLNEYRFAHAQHLLVTSDKSLTEIAFECGFGSVRNFNRVYREFSGKSPTAR